MAVPSNNLQVVETYVKSELAFLQNSFCLIDAFDKRFRNFQNYDANLGDAITFNLTPRFVTKTGLTITQQPSVQRVHTLKTTQAYNQSTGYNEKQFTYNVQDYMQKFGEAAMYQLCGTAEKDIARTIIGGMIGNDPQDTSTVGIRQTDSGPYRFFGGPNNPITSPLAVAQMVANFEAYGIAGNDKWAVMPIEAFPQINNAGLAQFATERNNRIANKWDRWEYGDIMFKSSNLLPSHLAGSVGDSVGADNILTVVSTNDPTGQNITQITFSVGAGISGDATKAANAIKAGDLLEARRPGSSDTFPFVNFLTFQSQADTSLPLSLFVLADASVSGGNVTVTVRTTNDSGIVSAANQNQNTPIAIQPGIEFTVVPSHKAGMLTCGNQNFLAMPRLSQQEPFDTVTITDDESGASLRHYWGAQFGQNNKAYVRDLLLGATVVPEYAMRLIFPL